MSEERNVIQLRCKCEYMGSFTRICKMCSEKMRPIFLLKAFQMFMFIAEKNKKSANEGLIL